MAGTQITSITTKQDLMVGLNCLNVAYSGSGDGYTVSGMIECAGAWYRFVDEAVTVTTSDYIKIVPSTGTATLAAITSFSGVTFDTDKNGYYVTGTNERVFAYRNTSTSCYLMQNENQMIYGKSILNGAIEANGYFTFTGNIMAPSSNFYYATLLSPSGTYIIPRGFYNISVETNVLFFEMQDSGSTWRYINSGGGFVISDGINFRIRNTSSTTSYGIYIRKLDGF